MCQIAKSKIYWGIKIGRLIKKGLVLGDQKWEQLWIVPKFGTSLNQTTLGLRSVTDENYYTNLVCQKLALMVNSRGSRRNSDNHTGWTRRQGVIGIERRGRNLAYPFGWKEKKETLEI